MVVLAGCGIPREYYGQVSGVRIGCDAASQKTKVAVKNRVKTKQYALLISPRVVTRGDSIFPHGTFAVRTVHLDGEKISTPMDASFNGLVFACQWDENHSDQPTYDWKTFYREVWKIDHADAEKMIKLLRKVKRISSSASARSFGEYVVFVAKAVRIKRALRELDHATPLSSYNFHEYVPVESSEVAKVINEVVDQVRSSAVKSARRRQAGA
jgi:hypothetical protein